MKALLVALTNPASPEVEDAYNDWYTNIHIPDVLQLPGYVSATRYKAFTGWEFFEQRYLTLVELNVESEAEVRAVRDEHLSRAMSGKIAGAPDGLMDRDVARTLYYTEARPRQVSATLQQAMPDGLFMAYASPASADKEAEFHRWYDETHISDVLKVPGFFAAQRFIRTDITIIDKPWVVDREYLAIYEHALPTVEQYNASFDVLKARIGSGEISMSDALTPNNPAAAYQRISDTIVAG